jgi:hypothetical protein
MELARLQDLLYRIITAPSGVAEGLANEQDVLGRDGLDGLICGDDQLSAQDHLEIYANAYFYRLLDVLREDFRATLTVLGDDQFHNLITGYLIDHPPTEPSIQHAGRYLPDFLRRHPLSESRPFLADLATLERTLLEVFHSANAIPLAAEELSAIEPAEWPAIGIATHPALCILDLDWHVEDLVRAIEEKQSRHVPACGPLKLLVWRFNSRVLYRELELSESAALKIAKSGTTFAAICDAVAQEAGAADPAPLISRLLGEWLSAGLLIRRAP